MTTDNDIPGPHNALHSILRWAILTPTVSSKNVAANRYGLEKTATYGKDL
jgi:hypothetical protein